MAFNAYDGQVLYRWLKATVRVQVLAVALKMANRLADGKQVLDHVLLDCYPRMDSATLVPQLQLNTAGSSRLLGR